MQRNKIHIVCTRKLSPEIVSQAGLNGIDIQGIDFLKIQPKSPDQFECKLLKNSSPLVFTSKYAVQAVCDFTKQLSHLPVWAIKGSTSAQLESAGLRVEGVAKDAYHLAQLIIQSGVQSVLHCTTHNRRVELKNALELSGVNYKYLEVYNKMANPKKIENYEGLVFFSPSQVDSFLALNELYAEIPVFCIGKTTANHLKALHYKNVIVAEESSEQNLLQTLLNFYIK
jgi:uroporphyrinogen-III synthase